MRRLEQRAIRNGYGLEDQLKVAAARTHARRRIGYPAFMFEAAAVAWCGELDMMTNAKLRKLTADAYRNQKVEVGSFVTLA